ncbi:MAG: hypothetical protein U1E76_10350 [Planctomycetota bacterium]
MRAGEQLLATSGFELVAAGGILHQRDQLLDQPDVADLALESALALLGGFLLPVLGLLVEAIMRRVRARQPAFDRRLVLDLLQGTFAALWKSLISASASAAAT